MKRIFTMSIFALLSSASLAQDFTAAARDLQQNGLTPVERLALESFATTWDGAAQQEFWSYYDVTTPVDLSQGWQNFDEGLRRVADDLHYGSIDEARWQQDVQQVLNAQQGAPTAVSRMSSEDLARLFVAAQALRMSAIGATGGDMKYCIFIIYCSVNSPWP